MKRDTFHYRAGAASAVITPKDSMWLAGWGVRTSPSRGTVNDLHAKALALEDSRGNRIVIVNAELVAVPPEISAEIAAQVSRKHGVRRDQIMLCATHTHCGPEVRPDKIEFFKIWPEMGAKIVPYVQWLTQTIVELVDRAIAKLKSARLIVRETQVTFAVNRRASRGAADHGVDHQVPVLDVTDASGQRIAILFGYACHNTCIDPQDGRYCGDWAGFAAEQLEAAFPGTAAMFIMGAGADQHVEPRFTIDLSRGYAKQIAGAVIAAMKSEPGREIHGDIRTAFENVPLPYEPIPSRQQLEKNLSGPEPQLALKSRYLLRAMEEGRSFGDAYPCPIQVVRLGDELLMIGIGGEPVIDFAHMMRREFAGPVVWVAGYCNDMFGYIPTRAILAEGGYEGGRSLWWSALPMPFTGEAEGCVMNGARRLVRKLRETPA